MAVEIKDDSITFEDITDGQKESIKNYANENWRDFIDEEYSTDASMAGYKGFNDVSTSYISTKKLVGQKGIILPGEGATEEELNDFHRQMGRPDDSDGYDLAFNEDITADENFSSIEENLTANRQTFQKTMHKLGIPASTAKELWADSQSKYLETLKVQKESNQERLSGDLAGVKKELGAAFDEKMKLADNTAATVMSPELFAWFKESGLFAEPKMKQIWSKVGDMISEDKINIVSKASDILAPKDAKSKLNALLSKDSTHPLNTALWNKKDPRHKEALELMNNLSDMSIASDKKQ